ncbi:MAG: FtsQ-type POTRA domain-containing protein [Syntrophomonadaceae bacterium]|jgi:cell division protein FtsQ|nr:FtsQ-type POTRA domain-containing protein [Syntrophomonadaceae bacterium]
MSQKKSHRFFIVVLLMLVVLVSGFLFLHSSFFDIADVIISGNNKVSNDEILTIADIKTDANIFLLDSDLICNKLRVHPIVKDAKIVKHFPNKIEIKISEREIWALVPFQNMFLCLDEEGVCIDRITSFSFESYPVVTMENMPERVNLGHALYPQAIINVKKLWDYITPEQREKISDFHLRNDNMDIIIYTLAGTEIRFGNIDRLEEKLSYFSYIFEQEESLASVGTQVLEYIDLSFQGQPVVKIR